MDVFSVGVLFFKYSLYACIFLVYKIVWLILGPLTTWLVMLEPMNNKSFKANWKEGSLLMLTALTDVILCFKVLKDLAWYKYGENNYANESRTYKRTFAAVIDNDMKLVAFRFLFTKKLYKEKFLKCDFGWRLNRLDRGQKRCGFIFSIRFLKGGLKWL